MHEQTPPRIISSDTLRDVRIPPGQVQTRKWPVLHMGTTPVFDPARWDLRVWGEVSPPRRFTWDEFRALPHGEVFADMHCVTRWSRLNMVWTGVPVRELVHTFEILPTARFVIAHCEQGFTTNMPLVHFLADDAILAWAADGADLEPDHGWPLRLVIPQLYAWKSAKWLRGLEFVGHDRPGYWEAGGYHMRGDPWTEERFGS